MEAARLRSPLPRRLGSLVLGAVLAVGLLGTPVRAAERHRVEVGVRADFVAQTNFVQCIGASLQMMINMIEPGRDRTAKEQRRLQELARYHSPSRPDGRQRQGASVRGWVRVLIGEVEQPYRLVGLDTLEEAVALAARAMDETSAPVGLSVVDKVATTPMRDPRPTASLAMAASTRTIGWEMLACTRSQSSPMEEQALRTTSTPRSDMMRA